MKKIFTLCLLGYLACAIGHAQNLVIQVNQAGTLHEQINEAQKNTTTHLKVVGNLDGNDILVLREMAGKDKSAKDTEGKLTHLDLSEAHILDGGVYAVNFSGKEFVSEANKIGDSMFKFSKLQSIILPQDITAIGADAFVYSTQLQSVTLPEGITTIGDYAFSNCTSLSAIQLPSSLTTLGEAAFRATALTQIDIPQNTTSIGKKAFMECSQLVTAQIRGNLETLEESCFADCKLLANVTLPPSIYLIQKNAFSYCAALRQIHLPENLLRIGENAFGFCKSLEEIVLSSNLSNVSARAFMSCTALRSVTIPNSVNAFGNYAFYGCKNIQEIHMLMEEPPIYKNFPFDKNYKATLYVPKSSLDLYQSTEPWNQFISIKPERATGITSTTIPTPVGWYNLQGIRLPNPQKGINLLKMSDGTVVKRIIK